MWNACMEALSVSKLNEFVREILEANFPLVWVEGEVSNFSPASSGHWYFTLKDEKAQVRCAMFRAHAMRAGVVLKNGLQVKVQARVSLYEGRGDYQLIVTQVEDAGFGALQRAFEALKKKCLDEGLFAHKRALPAFPKVIGVITSPIGAALQDILTTLRRRYPLAAVVIYPTAVQGKQAAPEIARALERASRHGKAEVLIVARGGGSLEDLWGFNEEVVIRAAFACPIPIVSGVGHETDTTLMDFVADVRAPTPTGAAEWVTPDGEALCVYLKDLQKTVLVLMQRKLFDLFQQVDGLSKRLKHPADKIAALLTHLTQLKYRFLQTLPLYVQHKRERLRGLMRTLHALSPLNTLERGYSITRQEGRVITDVADLEAEKPLEITLWRGMVVCYQDSFGPSSC